MSHSMEAISIKNLGGVEIDPGEMFTDELIAYVNHLNPDLGEPGKDPYYNEYKAFVDEINASKIITLDAEEYQHHSKFDDMDLSGDSEETKDISNDYFLMFMGAMLFCGNNGITPYDLKGEEYAPFEGRGVAPMDNTTVPA